MSVLRAILLVSMAVLVGCSATTKPAMISKTSYIVIEPPKELLVCPQFNAKSLPNPSTLTNEQVATVIKDLMKLNGRCGVNMAAIRNFIEQAKKVVPKQ